MMEAGVIKDIQSGEDGSLSGAVEGKFNGVVYRFKLSPEDRDRVGDMAVGDDVKFEGDIYEKTAKRVHPVGEADYAGGFVTLVHEASGLKQEVKLGFSWTVFFLGFFFGIPLFLRRLIAPGIIMCALMFVHYLLMFQARYVEIMGETYFFLFGAQVSLEDMGLWFLAYAVIGLSIQAYFGAKANQWFVRQLLQDGYRLPADSKPAVVKSFQDYAETIPQVAAASTPATTMVATPTAGAPVEAEASQSVGDRLRRLKDLLEEGLISDEEYQSKRKSMVDAI